MVQKQLGQFDAVTGEIIEDGFFAYIPTKRQNGFAEGWFSMSQAQPMDTLIGFTTDPNIKVFFSLLKHLDYQNYLMICQADLARELGMARSNFNRSMKSLIEIEALLVGPRSGTSRTYRLNPNFGWKGSAKNHVKALDEYEAQRYERMKKANIKTVLEGGNQTEEAPSTEDPRQLSLFSEE